MSTMTIAEAQVACNGVLIKGDNIEVLNAFGSGLDGRVRCVYMDPPYRNGENYSHYSDMQSHDEWLADIANLLPRIWSTLSEDGSVWISIDDMEMAYLKVLCDVHFGRGSYIATVVWEHRTTRENRPAFSHNHEYLLVYAKNPELFKKRRGKIEALRLLSRYKNPDKDPRGPWQSVTLTAQAGHAVDSQFYELVSPITGKVNYPPKGRAWIYSEERMQREVDAGNVWFGKDGNGSPRKKMFLSEATPTVVPSTLWRAEEAGTTLSAKKQLLKMFPDVDGEVFDTPKPEELLSIILSIATKPGDLVLDPYLGSGTTAAVAQKTGRNYIGIDCGSKSFEFASERMCLVEKGEQSGISRKYKWRGGGNHCSFKLLNKKLIADI